jgi:hypothetical protein
VPVRNSYQTFAKMYGLLIREKKNGPSIFVYTTNMLGQELLLLRVIRIYTKNSGDGQYIPVSFVGMEECRTEPLGCVYRHPLEGGPHQEKCKILPTCPSFQVKISFMLVYVARSAH